MNPYLIIAGLVALALAASSDAYFGYEYRDGKVAKEIADAQSRAIQGANDQADRDKKLAVEQATVETQARTTAMMIRNRANVAITAKPQPTVCDWDTNSFGVLVASVGAANGQTSGTAGLSNAVRSANGPGK